MRQTLQRALASSVRLPYLPLWIGPLFLFLKTLISGQALFWGTPALQFVPWYGFAWDALQSGQLPLWNPQVGMGAPLLANYQSALFYPPTWVYFLLAALGEVPALAWGQALLVVIHLSWAGFGMATLARRMRLGVLSQTVCGLAFSLSGYMVARAGFLSINATAAWLPWLLILAFDLVRGDGARRSFSLLSLVAGLMLLAGHAQTAAYAILLTFGWIGFWGWERYRLHGTWLQWTIRAWGRAGLAFVGAAGLAAVQLLPTTEYLLESQRAAAVDYEIAMTYSYWPWRLITFLAPDLFGNPVQGDYWGYGAYWEDAVYIGLLPFVLGIGLVISCIWPRRVTSANPDLIPGRPRATVPLVRTLAGLLVITLVLALGQNTPIFPWLYRFVPGFDMFQAPTRFMLWAVFALSLLAALAVHTWRRPIGRGLYWTRLGTAGALAVSVGAGLAWVFMGDIRPTFIRAAALAGFWGLGIGILALTAPEKNTSAGFVWWPWAVTLLVSADLLVAGWGLNPGVPANFYRGRSTTADQIVSQLDGGRLFLQADQEYHLKFERFLRFSSFDLGESWGNLRAVLLPNLHMLDGIRHTANFDPLVPGRYSQWMAALEDADPRLTATMLNLSGVTLVEFTDSETPLGINFRSVEGGSDLFRWIDCGRWVQDGEAAWEAVTAPSFDYKSEILLEGVELVDPGCSNAQLTAFEVLKDRPNHASLALETDGPGWLFQSAVWYPGWIALVDGERVPLYTANFLFRAVPVEAGVHQVDILYRPYSFYLGALISLGAWIWIGVRFVRNRS